MSRGDILLYAPSSKPYSWDGIFERLICARTGGPYCHVEVDLGDGTSIGALGTGVERHPRSQPAAYAGAGALCPPDELTRALTWLRLMVGSPYGWGDIQAAALGLNLPEMGDAAHVRYDCSHLALVFLIKAGYSPHLPAELKSAPRWVSPNDIARALGLIKNG